MSASPPRLRRRPAWRAVAFPCIVALLIAALPVPTRAETVLSLAEGTIVLELVGEDDRPLAAAELPEKSAAIALRLQAEVDAPVRVTLRLLAVEVPGLAGSSVLKETSHRLGAKDELWRAALPLPWNAEIGRYAVEAAAGGQTVTLPFALVPQHPPALLVEGAPAGSLDVALAALGGKVVQASSVKEHYRGAWNAENLLDGFRSVRDAQGALLSGGWQSERDDWPAEVVLGFHGDSAPLVEALLFEPAALDRALPKDYAGLAPRSEVPRFVEILAGDSVDPASFRQLAIARLWNRTVPQLVRIEPQPVRYLKLRVLENYGAATTALAELRVLAFGAAESILAGRPVNLARPALGGAVLLFTSQDRDNPVAALVDGVVGTGLGWSSATSGLGDAARLPQDLVFGFRGGGVAEIDRIEIDLESSRRWAVGGTPSVSWPRLVAVGVTLGGPDGPFEEIGRFALQAKPGPQVIPVNRSARHLRLRVLETNGGSATTIGEVSIIEEQAPAAGSLLLGEDEPTWEYPADDGAAVMALPQARGEREPNDSPETGEPLVFGERVEGIAGGGDSDHYLLTLTGDAPRVVRLDLQGDGRLRLGLRLTDAAGATVKTYVPAAQSSQHAQFAWRLDAGTYVLAVAPPERVTALVWDTSGSMEARVGLLQRAIYSYVEGLTQGERLVLLRFSDKVESLQPTPSDDRDALLALLEGKFRAEGGTHLYDALDAAADALQGDEGLRSVILLTDGQDSGSETPLPELRRRLAESGLRLIAIGVGSDLSDFGQGAGATGHGVLRSLAQTTGGRYIAQPQAEALPALYRALAEAFARAQRYSLQLDIATAEGALAVLSEKENLPILIGAPRVVLVVDASGSMKRSLGGRSMMRSAQEVLTAVVQALPDGIDAALWSFGHRLAEGQAGDCADIEQLVPLGPIDRQRLSDAIAALRAFGTTPLGATLQQVGDALPDDGRRQLVVLVTDGEEECGADLPAVARTLTREHPGLSLNIVGFALDQPEVLATLGETAAAGQGRLLLAAAAPELENALAEAFAAPFVVLDAAGSVVAEGRVGGGSLTLPAARYDLSIATRDAPLLIEGVEIVAGGTVTVHLERQGEEFGTSMAREKDPP